MLLGRLRPIRDEGSTVATTALFVVTAGQAEQARQAREWGEFSRVTAGFVAPAANLATSSDQPTGARA